ncbi:MAG: hypothetical protein IVW56_09645 [Candidatus Binataceae bacterium]|nr:hypothetical protein [Candidatus Binataceae bacterium]
MPDFVTLVAPPGTDEANHGTERYRVGNDRTVRVPREAARHLIHNAGFKLAPEKDGDGATEAQSPPRMGT